MNEIFANLAHGAIGRVRDLLATRMWTRPGKGKASRPVDSGELRRGLRDIETALNEIHRAATHRAEGERIYRLTMEQRALNMSGEIRGVFVPGEEAPETDLRAEVFIRELTAAGFRVEEVK